MTKFFRPRRAAWLLAACALALAWALPVAAADEVPRITVETLNAELGSPDLLIIDARRGGDWTSTPDKIRGAVREDRPTAEWAADLPKTKKVVFYCA